MAAKTRSKAQLESILFGLLFLIVPDGYTQDVADQGEGAGQENGAVHYFEAVSKVRYPDDPGVLEKMRRVMEKGMRKEDPVLEDLLQKNREAMEAFERGVALDRCNFQPERSLSFDKIKQLKELLLIKARCHELRNNPEAAQKIYLSILVFARHLAMDPGLHMKAFALALEGDVYGPLKHLLQMGGEDRVRFRRAYLALEESVARHFAIREAVEGEKAFFISTVELLLPAGDSHEGLSKEEQERFADFMKQLRNEAQHFSDAYFELAIVAAESNRPADWKALNDWLKEMKGKSVPPDLEQFLSDLKESAWKNPEKLNKELATHLARILLLVSAINFKPLSEHYHRTLGSLKELRGLAKKMSNNRDGY